MKSDTETTGIGDAVFLVKYAFPDLLGQRSTISFGAGAKAPIGKVRFYHFTRNSINGRPCNLAVVRGTLLG